MRKVSLYVTKEEKDEKGNWNQPDYEVLVRPMSHKERKNFITEHPKFQEEGLIKQQEAIDLLMVRSVIVDVEAGKDASGKQIHITPWKDTLEADRLTWLESLPAPEYDKLAKAFESEAMGKGIGGP